MDLFFLATSAPDAAALGAFIKILAWLAGAAAVAIGLFISLYRTMFNPPFARKSEVEDLRVNFDVRQTAASNSRKQIYAQVEHVESRLARVEEQNVAQADSVNLLSNDFREFAREQRAANLEILKRLK